MYTMIYTLDNFFIDQRESAAWMEPIIQIEIILTWKTPIIGRNTERKIIKFPFSIYGIFFFYSDTLGARTCHGDQKRAKWGNKIAVQCRFLTLGKCLSGEKGIQIFKFPSYSLAGSGHKLSGMKQKFMFQNESFWRVFGEIVIWTSLICVLSWWTLRVWQEKEYFPDSKSD